MKNLKKHIWIESEEDKDTEWDLNDCFVEVIVTFPDRSRWVGNFCTYKHLQTFNERNKQNGGNLNGTYFWCNNMILVDKVTREVVEATIDDLIRKYHLRQIFEEYSEYDPMDQDEDIQYPEDFFI